MIDLREKTSLNKTNSFNGREIRFFFRIIFVSFVCIYFFYLIRKWYCQKIDWRISCYWDIGWTIVEISSLWQATFDSFHSILADNAKSFSTTHTKFTFRGVTIKINFFQRREFSRRDGIQINSGIDNYIND